MFRAAVLTIFFGLLAVSLLPGRDTTLRSAAPTPVIVELFTSQGCSSCPPADALLIRLEQQQLPGVQVLALSQHVDYWNRLGWADPYSSGQFSRRQSEYAEAFGRDGIYTPQMIVDGQAEFVGSDERRARSAIKRASSQAKAPVTVSFTPEVSGRALVRIQVGALPPEIASADSEVMLAITESGLANHVPRGENTGRHIAHTGVVRQFKSLGRLGEPGKVYSYEVSLPAAWQQKNLTAVAFLQDRGSKRIRGAGAAKYQPTAN